MTPEAELELLREAIRVYAHELMKTDYRGNPPPEHAIGRAVLALIGEEA